MKGRTAALVVLVAFVLAMAIAPGALAKSPRVAASGAWTWVPGEDGTDTFLPSGHEFLQGYEVGQWTGTFTASDTYEPYVAMFTKSAELWAKLWIHFEDATVDMGGAPLHGDMTMLVTFHAGTDAAGWRILNGTGDLQQLGGEGTLVWTDAGMDYSGMIWRQK